MNTRVPVERSRIHRPTGIAAAPRDMREALVHAAVALRANPLRSVLGALAIFVAVGTMTLVSTAFAGLQSFARSSAARAFGSDTFVVAQIASTGRISREELARKQQRNPPIRRADVRFLDRYADGGVVYAPNAQHNTVVTRGNRRYDYAAVTGTSAALPEIRELGIDRGRFFVEAEEERAAQVAVIGADIVEALFPAEDPLGQTLRVGGRGFTIVGTQGRLGASGGASLDRYVWIPLQAYERAFGAPMTLQVFAKAPEPERTAAAEERARTTMRARRQLAPGVEDTFDVLVPDAARNFVLSLSQRIGVAAIPISAMALLAAIVVVTNTVLVSVSQRTREIGVRRAVGATRAQIAREVLAESSLVSLVGGCAAIAAVWVVGEVASRATGLALRVEPATALGSLAAATLSGVIAGWYPARRATRIDVVTALRTE